MSYATMPIVGAFYRPPAALVCSLLPVGQELVLYAEPQNEHDANAVAVWLMTDNIAEATQAALEERLPEHGLTLEQFLAQDEWHLGYIPKELAAQLKATETVIDGTPLNVTFATSATGKPAVRFASPVL